MPGGLAALAGASIGKYRYVSGGAPVTGTVDCSSLINQLIGVEMGLAIPGFKRGAYTGRTHGPVVIEYATTTLAVTVTHPSVDDLVIWPGIGPLGHIGVVTGPDQMVSALNPARGVERTPIKGYGPTPVPIYRRYKAVGDGGLPWDGSTSGGPIITTAAPGLTGCVPAMVLMPALIPLALYRRRHDGGM